ncbi:MAG: anti-phage protein KwaA [Lachnospiraceae bacterium]|nr:anti-phage protein KwaA [Lachnospiraceae bacterium]
MAKKKDGSKSLKYKFYIMSLWLLFVLIFLLTVDIPISIAENAECMGILPLLKRNWLAICSLIFALLGLIFAAQTNRKWSGVTNPPYQIKEIKNENYEYLTFLTTYIIPLICIDLGNIRYVIVLAVLLVMIGFIFVKMELYYGNPTLALMGYRLYRAEINGIDAPDGVILISRDRLSKDSAIKWIPLDKYVWIAKEIKSKAN